MAKTKTYKVNIDASQAKSELENVQDALNETSKSAKKTGKANKETFGSIGNNVKDLTSKLKNGEIGLKSFSKGILSAGKAMIKVFVTNPILLALTAITAAIVGLVKIFKDFTPIVKFLEKSFAALTAGFDILKKAIIGLITGQKSLRETFQGLTGDMKDAATAAVELKQAQYDLEDAAQALTLTNARLQTEIQKLLIQAKDVTKSDEERIALLEKTIELEKQQLKGSQDIAKEELRIAKERLLNVNNLNAEQIQAIKDLDIAKINSFKDEKNLDEEILQSAIDAAIKMEDLERQSLAITEQAQVDKNAILEQAAAKEEKRRLEEQAARDEQAAKEKELADKRIAEEERVREEKQRLLELQKQDIDDFYSDLNDSFEEQIEKEQEQADIILQQELDNTIKNTQMVLSEKERLEKEQEEKDLERARKQEEAKRQIFKQSFEAIQELDRASTAVSIRLQENRLKNGLISQEEYDQKVAEIQEKAAKREKAYAIVSTIIATAQSIMGIWKDFPKIDFGVTAAIMSGVVAALGAAQIATIASASPGNTQVPQGSVSAPSAPTQTAPQTSFSFDQQNLRSNQDSVSRTYVVSREVRNQDQLDRQVIGNGTI